MTSRVILQDRNGSRWLQFGDPLKVLATNDLATVPGLLLEVESEVEERGLYAAGYISYEAAPAFDKALAIRATTKMPLIWFGLYERPSRISLPTDRVPYDVGDWQPSINRAEYNTALKRIKRYISLGETYQVNYTYRLSAAFEGDPWGLFLDLVQAQEPTYSAYVDLGSHVICSASPELFFKLDGTELMSRPMKGTVERGRTLLEDRAKAAWLYHSEKNRAENVMIVDMIRNDVGRVSNIGSVTVPRLFDVERYPTIWQMTSTVTSQTEASLADIITALFPCASITGAPKVSTMAIIAELESSPRGAYTGCIGYFAPGRKAQFNVAIRTAVIDVAQGQAEFGLGGGIVWDSGMDSEFAESLLKAQILFKRRPDFHLLESFLWTPEEGYFLMDEHLQRLADSASYFGYCYDPELLKGRLADLSSSLPKKAQKVRLLLDRDGAIHLEAASIENAEPAIVALARAPVHSDNVFLYHKTTNRSVYDGARSAEPDCDDVLLWNERKEVTEATTANIVVELEGELLTPPVDCGLLAGTFRNHLLAEGIVREQVIPIADLERCPVVYLVNSVRKWRKAKLRPQVVIGAAQR